MNRTYSLVWNRRLKQWVAASELARSCGMPGSGRVRSGVAAAVLALAIAGPAAAADLAPGALPTGGTVAAGQAAIATSGNRLDVTQGSQRAIINWQGFDIGSQAQVNFVQPNSSAVALNRVSGPTATRIEGQLNANGQVFLVNPNGILFGGGARVNVGGLVASTLNIRDADFLAGNYSFNGSGGSIENQGTISAAPGGYLAFIAPKIINSGTISAPQGTVAMGAGERVRLNFPGDRLVGLDVSAETIDTLIENRQAIKAEGGAILLTVAGAEAVTRSVINNRGVLEASSLTSDGGRIVLTAGNDINLGSGSTVAVDGQKGGEITVQAKSGTLLADGTLSARGTTGTGGNVQLLGHQVGLINAAQVDASGATGGGTVLVGGDYQGKQPDVQNAAATFVSSDAGIKANATLQGDGGKVIVWADGTTRYLGNISADGAGAGGSGGFVETSGKETLIATGQVSATSPYGLAGTWLLDPNNITIQAAGSNTNVTASPTFTSTNDNAIVTTGSIQTALNAGTSVAVTTGSGGTNAQAGNITVASAIAKTAGGNATLTLNATNNIVFNTGANVTSTTGVLGLTLNAGGAINTMRGISLNGGALTLNAAGAVTQSSAIAGNTSVVKNGAGLFTLSQNNTYTGATTISAGTLALGNNDRIANTSAVTVDGATAVLALGNRSDTVGTVTVSNGGSITGTGTLTSTGTFEMQSGVVSARLGGTGIALNKTTAGTVTLSGANTYTGATNISAGTLALNATGTIAASSGVANNGTFTTAAAKTIDSMTGTGNTVLGGTLTIGDASNTGSAYGGVVSGAGGITKAGTGTLTLSGANTYTGTTTVSAGTLVASNSTALGTTAGGTAVATGATLALQGGIAVGAETLAITGVGAGNNGALRNLSGDNAWGGTVRLSGNAEIQSDIGTLTLSAANAVTNATATARSLTIDGAGNTVINGAITTSTGTLTKNGTGTLTLSGANTYTGTTTINAGRLRYGVNNAIASGAVVVNNGGTYDLNNFSDTIGALAVNSGTTGGTVTTGAGTLTLGGNVTSTGGAANATISGNLALGGNRTFTSTNAADGLTVSAVISGANTLTKAGAGTLTLSGANTYTGTTTVSAGTLVASNSTALGTTAGGTAVATGATLALQGDIAVGAETLTITGAGVGNNGALRNLSGNNAWGGAVALAGITEIQSDAGTLTLGTANSVTGTNRALTIDGAGNTAINGTITTGAGTLTKSGTGTLTLSGANTYTGTTTINAGTLAVTANNALGTTAAGTTVASGATLDFRNVAYATTEAVTLNGGTLATSIGTSSFAGPVTLGANSNVDVGGTQLTLSGAIGGAGFGIAKQGNGTLVLSGTNTYTGATNINAGTLAAANSAALGGTGGGTNVGSNARLRIDGVALGAEPVTLNGPGLFGTGAITSTGTASLAGPVTLAGDAVIAPTSGSILTLSGPVDGAAGLTAGGFGTLNLNGAVGGVTPLAFLTTLATAPSSATGIGASVRTTGNQTYNNPTTLASGVVLQSTTGSLSAPGAVVATAGPVSLRAAGNVVFQNAANDFGTVAINAGANVALRDSNAIDLGVSSIGGSLSLVTGGAVTDSGAISVGGATTINAGAANDITLDNANNFAGNVGIVAGWNVRLNDVNDLTLDSSSFGTLTATAAGTVALAGTLTASGTGDAIVLLGSRFVNSAGAGALSAPNGRWLVWSSNPNPFGGATPDNRGGLAYDFKQYNATYGVTPVGQPSGNGFLYSLAPTITPGLTGTVSKVYDTTTTAPLTAANFTPTIGVDGDAIAMTATGGYDNPNVAGSPTKLVTATGIATTVTSSIAEGSKPVYGYTLTSTSANANIGEITPAPLTITGNTTSSGYTAALQTNGFTTSGLLGSDSVTSVATLASGTNVGTYADNLTSASGSGLTNYAIGYVNGSLKITPAPLVLQAASGTKVYDGTTVSNGVVGANGLVGGDTVSGLTQSYKSKNVLGTNGSTLLVNGGYTISDGNGGNNYAVTTASAAGTITPAALSITANDAQRAVDTENPQFSATYAGFVGGETPAVLNGALEFSTPATIASPAGAYPITPFGQTSSNYTIAYVDGVLQIVAGPGVPGVAPVALFDQQTIAAQYSNPEFLLGNLPAVLYAGDGDAPPASASSVRIVKGGLRIAP